MIGEIILKGAKEMNIALPEDAERKFDEFYGMLTETNAHMNLARALNSPKEASEVHFLDALAPLSVKGLMDERETLIDVGSGAGFPGVVLSIARPTLRVTLLDALKKRVDFLNGVISALDLNAEAVHVRAEDAGRDVKYREAFDFVTARAVADLSRLSEWTIPLARVGGRVIAYKGPAAIEEIAAAADSVKALGGAAARVEPISIPGRAEWTHVLVVVDKVRSTPANYPLRPSSKKKASVPRK